MSNKNIKIEGSGINPHHWAKRLLDEFWRKFGNGNKVDTSPLGKDATIAILKTYDKIVLPFQKRQSLKYRRSRFNRVKKHRHSLTTHEQCFCCGAPATARHHVLELNNGGGNASRNILSICFPCHKQIHPWITW